jgi:hypothetical protein
LFWSGAIGFGLAAPSHLQFAYVAAAIGHACANVGVVAINQIAAARLVDFAASCTTVLTRIRKMQVEACPRANASVSRCLVILHRNAPCRRFDTASAGHKIVSIERGSRKILLKPISLASLRLSPRFSPAEDVLTFCGLILSDSGLSTRP